MTDDKRMPSETPRPWNAMPKVFGVWTVEREIRPAGREHGRSCLADVICEVSSTESRYGEPARTAEENARRIADALNVAEERMGQEGQEQEPLDVGARVAFRNHPSLGHGTIERIERRAHINWDYCGRAGPYNVENLDRVQPSEEREFPVGACVIVDGKKGVVKCVRDRIDARLVRFGDHEATYPVSQLRDWPGEQIETDGVTVWVNAPHCIGRFGRHGFEIGHDDPRAAVEHPYLYSLGVPPPAETNYEDWRIFVREMKDWYGIEISDQYRPERCDPMGHE